MCKVLLQKIQRNVRQFLPSDIILLNAQPGTPECTQKQLVNVTGPSFSCIHNQLVVSMTAIPFCVLCVCVCVQKTLPDETLPKGL